MVKTKKFIKSQLNSMYWLIMGLMAGSCICLLTIASRMEKKIQNPSSETVQVIETSTEEKI